MTKKNPARTQATRQKIMDAYWSLLEASPNSRITASQVVQAAGINRSTFYEYFDNADAVRESIEEDTLAYMKERVAILLGESIEEWDAVQTALQILQDKGKYIAFLYLHPASSGFAQKAKAQLIRMLADSLATANAIDAYRFEFVASGILSVYALWFRNDRNIPLDELATQLKAMAVASLNA